MGSLHLEPHFSLPPDLVRRIMVLVADAERNLASLKEADAKRRAQFQRIIEADRQLSASTNRLLWAMRAAILLHILVIITMVVFL